MDVSTKREKRRQASVERAYWHVREVMQFLGREVAPVNVPRFLPDDCQYGQEIMRSVQSMHTSKVLGCYVHDAFVMVQPDYDLKRMELTLYHEVCHANQVQRDERHLPYWERPREVEAREIAEIAMKLRRKPREDWSIVYCNFIIADTK